MSKRLGDLVLWLEAKVNRNLQGNIYLGKQVTLARHARLITDTASRIVIEDEVTLGVGCLILARKGSSVRLRHHATIQAGTEIVTRETPEGQGGNLEVGEYVVLHKNNRIDLSGNVSIGEQVQTGEGCYIHTHRHKYDQQGVIWRQGVDTQDVTIGSGCWIGTNVQIMPGVTIGEGAVIAAGAIVTTNINPYAIAGGVPAKEIKQRFPRQASGTRSGRNDSGPHT